MVLLQKVVVTDVDVATVAVDKKLRKDNLLHVSSVVDSIIIYTIYGQI